MSGNGWALFGKISFGFGCVPVGMVIQAWAISTIWNWHVVDLLDAPVLGMWSAFGLSCLVSAFRPGSVSKDKEWSVLVGAIFGQWIGYVLLVFLGWIAT